jgi:hypothetical protein
MLLTLLLLLPGCDPAHAAREICRNRRSALDELYATYGGSDLTKAAGGGVLGNAIGEADRQNFEQRCIELGQGGHPTLLTDKAKAFFATPETVKTCQKVVDATAKVAEINRKLPADQQVTCP